MYSTDILEYQVIRFHDIVSVFLNENRDGRWFALFFRGISNTITTFYRTLDTRATYVPR